MKKEIIIAVVVTIIAFLLVHFHSVSGGGIWFNYAMGVPVGMLWGNIYFSEKNGRDK